MEKESRKVHNILVFECHSISKLLAIINHWLTEDAAVSIVLCSVDAEFLAESFALLAFLLKTDDLDQVVRRLTLMDPREACAALLLKDRLDTEFPSLNIASYYSHLRLRRHWRALAAGVYVTAQSSDSVRQSPPSPETMQSVRRALLNEYLTIHFIVEDSISFPTSLSLSSGEGLETYTGPHTFEIIYIPDPNMGSILITISLLPQPGRSCIVFAPDPHRDKHFNDIRILLGITIVHPLSRCRARSHISLHPAIWTLPRPTHDPLVVDLGQLARFCSRVYSEFQASTRAFVVFLSILRARLRIDWTGFMKQLLKLVDVPAGGMYFQSLCSELHIQNVYTVDAFAPDLLVPMCPFSTRTRAFTYFGCFTAVVCLVISCPPSSTLRTTSALCCEIVHAERNALHRFLPVHATYGHVRYERDILVIMEDDNIGSNLLATFWVPFWLLDVFPLALTSIKLVCHSEGIFSTHPLDTQHCFISPQSPVFSHSAPAVTSVALSAPQDRVESDVTCMLRFDKRARRVFHVGIRVQFEDSNCCALLEDGEEVHVKLLSPCEVELSVGGYTRVVTFPTTIDGKLEHSVWRHSHFIEIYARPQST